MRSSGGILGAVLPDDGEEGDIVGTDGRLRVQFGPFGVTGNDLPHACILVSILVANLGEEIRPGDTGKHMELGSSPGGAGCTFPRVALLINIVVPFHYA